MSVNYPVATPLRSRDLSRDISLIEATGVSASGVVLSRSRRRGPGAHREAGSNPWRTTIRELVMALSWGQIVVFRPAHRFRAV